jgi:hypothetical protein
MALEMVDMTETYRRESPRREPEAAGPDPGAALDAVVLPQNYRTVVDQVETAADRRGRELAGLLKPDGAKLYSDAEHDAREREANERWAAAARQADELVAAYVADVAAERDALGGDALWDDVDWTPELSAFSRLAEREVAVLPWPEVLQRLKRLEHRADGKHRGAHTDHLRIYASLVALRRGQHLERLRGQPLGTDPAGRAIGDLGVVFKRIEEHWGRGRMREEAVAEKEREVGALRRRLHKVRFAAEGGQQGLMARMRAATGEYRPF